MSKTLSFALAIFAALFVASCSNSSGSDVTSDGGSSGGSGSSTDSGSNSAAGVSDTSKDAAAAGWNTWYNTTIFSSVNPLGVTYDSSTKTASITVTKVDSSKDIGVMNAACQVGDLAAGPYVISFTAWTTTGTQRITSYLQEKANWNSTGSFDATLTTTPTKYSYSASFINACGAQVIFCCNSTTGTFCVKDVTVTKQADYPYVLPTSATAVYDSATGKTTVSFPCIPAAEHIYLYESATNDSSAATQLMDFEQSTQTTYYGSMQGTISYCESSPISRIYIAGYKKEGTSYLWISAKKAGGSESSKISAGSVTITGNFSNIANVPAGSVCHSIGSGSYSCTIYTGNTVREYFYAAAGSRVTFGNGGYPNSASVYARIYLAATTPSDIVLDSTYAWQTTDQSFTIPTTGYYIIELTASSTGYYFTNLSE
ncbi:MAG TPA: hypothetical protein PKO22_04215 [Treponemataceae bacterium]|nr:hypothetical protein [Treponemataceae bacterium]